MLPTRIAGDRRSKRRYPIRLRLHFKAIKRGVVTSAGTGEVIDMSSNGIAFRADETLRVGTTTNLYISWPIPLEGKTPIVLFGEGRAVRGEGQVTAVAIGRYEFRTQKQ
jgi:hypothetical protein